jgi:uncharacterized protein (TIGR00725 family)
LSARAIAVFGSSQTDPDSTEWIQAEAIGAAIAGAGFSVMTGGYGGTMEAASKGAAEAGGHTIGVIAPSLFPGRVGANGYVREIIEADGLTHRIGILVERAAGAIALPGSIGTAAELLIAWNVNHIARHSGGSALPTAAVGPAWREVASTLSDEIGAFAGDVHLVDSASEAVAWLIEQL